MFGDENQNKLTIKNTMKIKIVDSQGTNNEFITMIFEEIGKELEDKLKISYIYNINDLYANISQEINEKSEALLNTQWIEEISTLRPSVIILYYYIEEGSTKEEEEIKISKIIEDITLKDKYVYIYLFIIVPPQEFDIYQHLKNDDKSPNSLRKKLSKDWIYIFSSKDIWKTIELSKLCNSLIICSRNYYKQIKEIMKKKKEESNNVEEIVKYDIMMGILSIIKSKHEEVYAPSDLKEAHAILCSKSFDHKKYLYGKPETEKLNFYEIRAIADWILFKIMKLNFGKEDNSNDNKKKTKKIMKMKNNLDIQLKIDFFHNHIKTFSSFDYGEKEGDYFYFYKYFWLYKRYQYLIDFFEDNIDEMKEEKKYIHKISLFNFYLLFIFMKMIKFYKKYFKDIDMTTITINDTKLPISSIRTLSSIYYGKPPQYYYEDSNSGEKIQIGFNDEIHLKKLILNNDLTLDNMFNILKNEIIPNILLFYYKTSKFVKEYEFSKNIITLQNILKINNMKGLEIYLNMLRLKLYQEGIQYENYYDIPDINDTMFYLYKNFENSSNVKKFPKIYVNFLNKFTECLIYQMENNNENNKFDNMKKTSLFKSLCFLSTIKLLNEKEQDVVNQLLNDEYFIPVKEERKTIIQESLILEKKQQSNEENSINENENEKYLEKNENIEKNIEKNYIKKNDIVININNNNLLFKNQNNSFSFDYNIKDIDKSQDRKILDLVEYDFKISTKLEKLKLKFDNIKIFFVCINEERNDMKYKNKKDIIMKEYTKEELSNYELSNEKPLILEHKIFLKYKKGKIFASKIMFTLEQKPNIIFLYEIPNEFNKVIFINNLSKNVLNFYYKKNYKIGINQFIPFEFDVMKEKINEVEIKDLIIEFKTIPIMIFKEMSTIIPEKKQMSELITPKEEMNLKHIENLNFEEKSSIQNDEENIMNDKLNKLKNSEFFGKNDESNYKQLNKRISATTIEMNNLKIFNTNVLPNNNFDPNINKSELRRTHQISVKNNSPQETNNPTNIEQSRMLPPPEFYIYNEENNSLDKNAELITITYHNFESLLNQGKNKFKVLIKFLHEGAYKIKFDIVYYIRHIKIEDYIEYKEESILEFNVVKPFLKANDITTNNYQKNYNKPNQNEKENNKSIYLTNTKISMNLILTNKIEEDIQIKDINYEISDEKSIKYINSYINDLIHLYDIDEEEKKEILLIKKNSSFSIPFETEFINAFNGSLGKINIIWNTKKMEEYQEGKLNLLNQDIFEFPEIEVRPLEYEYEYKTQMIDNKQILLDIKIKNISNKSKTIFINVVNNGENNENDFIIIGYSKQTYLIREREEIITNFILIPNGRGELDYPYIKISEIDFSKKIKLNTNYYFSEKIPII